jgi:hypothetical protein
MGGAEMAEGCLAAHGRLEGNSQDRCGVRVENSQSPRARKTKT